MSYVAIVLTPESKQKILSKFSVPEGWELKCHHMTVNMGGHQNGPAKNIPLGSVHSMIINSIAQNDKVIAFGVKTAFPSVNSIKHITFAVGNGGKPKMSNELTNWRPIESFEVEGILQELA